MNEMSNDGRLPAPRLRREEGRGAVAVAERGMLADPARPDDRRRALPQIDVGDLLRVLLKWKWLILGLCIAGVAAAMTVTALSKRTYRASATLEINTTPLEIMGTTRSVQPKLRSEEQFLQTQYGLLRTRSLAERVARSLKLGDDPAFVAQRGSAQQRTLTASFRLMGGLEVQPVRGSNLVALRFTDTDPARAAAIVNAFAQEFIASNDQRRYDASAFARSFLQTRLAAARERLEASERQLVAYAQRQGILQLDHSTAGPGRGGDGPTSGSGDSLSTQSLTALNAALAGAIAERIGAEQRYRQAGANKATGEVLQDPAIQALRAERAKLQADYRERLSTFKPDFPEMVALRDRMTQIDQEIGREAGDVSSSLRSTYLAALGREAELRGQVSALRSNVLDLRNRGIGYTILQREVDTNRTIYDSLLQRYREIGVVGNLGESQAVIADNALPPRAPFSPRPFRNLLAGLVGGLVLGLVIALVIDFIDDTIKNADDVANKLKLPILGMVPRLGKSETLREELSNARSNVAEAYYSVTTSLRFIGSGGFPRSILVTSSRAGEGKSSSSLALAQNSARLGASVLLIDADLRKPSFIAKTSAGLSHLLAVPDEGIEPHVVKTSTPGLSLLPSGVIPPNPAELLATGRVQAIIAEAIERFDVVIVDAPPVLGLADAPILSSICEATMVVVEAGLVRRSIVLNALRRLYGADARIAGVVLTKYNPKAFEHAYGYAHGYGYGQEKNAGPAPTPLLDIAS